MVFRSLRHHKKPVEEPKKEDPPSLVQALKKPEVRIRSGGWARVALQFPGENENKEKKEVTNVKKTSKLAQVQVQAEVQGGWKKQRPTTAILETVSELRPKRCALCGSEPVQVKQENCACGGWWIEDRGAPLCIMGRNITLQIDKVLNYPLKEELVYLIFGYLSPHELAVCSLVSPQWNKVASSDPCWKHHCSIYGENKLPSHSWKEVFLEMEVEKLKFKERLAVAKRDQRNWKPNTKLFLDQNLQSQTEKDIPNPKRRPKPNLTNLSSNFQPWGGFIIHPDLTNQPILELSVSEFIKATKELINFLTKVNDIHPSAIPYAVQRYEKYLKLKAKYPTQILVPTADIEFVWLTHLKRPSKYRYDVKRLFGVELLDHAMLGSLLDMHVKRQALINTIGLWKKEYNEVYCTITSEKAVDLDRKAPYFEASNDGTSCIVMEGSRAIYFDKIILPEDNATTDDYRSPFTFSFDDIKKDQDWYGMLKVFLEKSHLQPTKLNDDDLVRFAKAYERYLYFTGNHSPDKGGFGIKTRNVPLPPTLAIDLMWHVHLCYPSLYSKDCRKVLDCDILEHNPWPSKAEKTASKKFRKIWRDEFGISITREHVYLCWDETDDDRSMVNELIAEYWRKEREKEIEERKRRAIREKETQEKKKNLRKLVKKFVTKLDSDEESNSGSDYSDSEDEDAKKKEDIKKEEEKTKKEEAERKKEEEKRETQTSGENATEESSEVVEEKEEEKQEEKEEKKEEKKVEKKFFVGKLDDSGSESDDYSDYEVDDY